MTRTPPLLATSTPADERAFAARWRWIKGTRDYSEMLELASRMQVCAYASGPAWGLAAISRIAEIAAGLECLDGYPGDPPYEAGTDKEEEP